MKEKQNDIITDLLIDFDEMGFAPTTAVPDPDAYAIEWKNKLTNALQGYHEQEWISVEDKLPEQSGKYLVCTKNGNVYQTKFYSYPENIGGHWGQKDKGRSITHWMPLPDAPKGGEEG